MATGTVKWFSDDKGFGFITPDDQGKDLFVHHTGIAGSGFKTLAEGAKVSYDAENGPKGPNATNVQTIQMASSSKKRTTMAKLNRERALIEKRQEKAARKAARKLAAAAPAAPSEVPQTDKD